MAVGVEHVGGGGDQRKRRARMEEHDLASTLVNERDEDGQVPYCPWRRAPGCPIVVCITETGWCAAATTSG